MQFEFRRASIDAALLVSLAMMAACGVEHVSIYSHGTQLAEGEMPVPNDRKPKDVKGDTVSNFHFEGVRVELVGNAGYFLTPKYSRGNERIPLSLSLNAHANAPGYFLEDLEGRLTLLDGSSLLPTRMQWMKGPCGPYRDGRELLASQIPRRLPVAVDTAETRSQPMSGADNPREGFRWDLRTCVVYDYDRWVDPYSDFAIVFGTVSSPDGARSPIRMHFWPALHRTWSH